MIVGVTTELHPGERRVALVPSVMPALAKAGMQVVLERGAGAAAGFADAAYEENGARVVAGAEEVFAAADVVPRIHVPRAGARTHLELFRPEQILLGLLDPLGSPGLARELAERRVTAFAFELLPRISRAQPMDALSSMATVAGYKAALLAAAELDKLFPLMMTAAGTVTPARVLVLGAGVAGLQAIATAHRLGAVVLAYDVRPAVKEQVESLGAKFLEVELDTQGAEGEGGYARAMGEEFYRRQRELMAAAVREADVVITTAVIPGRKAPTLVTAEMVAGMRPGSVVVDLAAESGGNCEPTRPGESVGVAGVRILGPVNLASSVPFHASQMYAHNVSAFLRNLVREGALRLDREDPILKETLLTHGGEVVNERVREMLRGEGMVVGGRGLVK
jgi:NAD(P) transhydrogenase subunit alpha